jgi:hypothetical protein
MSASFCQAQTSKLYLQVGGGYLLYNQLEQVGFDAAGPATMAYAEVGKTFRPLSIGGQQTFLQEYSFFKYRLKQQIQTLYAKYSFNQYLEFLPYGLDPYAMIGASFITNRFQTFDRENPSELINQEVISKPGYTFGAGLQAGIHRLIVGFHYQYTPGRDSFTLEDFETLPFATGSHLISLNIGIRLTAPEKSKRSRCPRFGGKGMLRF